MNSVFKESHTVPITYYVLDKHYTSTCIIFIVREIEDNF